jgi:predicted lactoylglutathione lyase
MAKARPKKKPLSDKIFVNLPVKNLKKSIAFFTKLGFAFDSQFTDDKATCMIIGKNIFAMLVVEKQFKDFSKSPISDTKKRTEVLLAVHVDGRKSVDAIVGKALKSGGRTYTAPQDYGWMYARSFADLDGHKWEIFHMDERKAPKNV